MTSLKGEGKQCLVPLVLPAAEARCHPILLLWWGHLHCVSRPPQRSGRLVDPQEPFPGVLSHSISGYTFISGCLIFTLR